VALGQVYYEEDRSLIFGPAILQVYYLENKMEIYSIIVLDESIINIIQEYEYKIVETNTASGNLE
jgi:hypothetical protein